MIFAREKEEQRQPVKLKLEFDGWHCLSKKQNKEVLLNARQLFINVNFFDKVGLIIESNDELEVHKFCLEILKKYKKFFKNWNGYNIKKISKKILYNYADKKRKLSIEYFKTLVTENKLEDIKLILAGVLYLDTKEVKDILVTIEKDFENDFSLMTDKELEEAYKIVLMFSSSKVRKFSLNK